MIETFYHLQIPLKFAFLSDTHDTDPSEILNSLRKQLPEMIVISGDFVRGEWAENGASKMAESQNAMSLLRECSDIAPTFLSMGNHERSLASSDFKIISDTGAVILDNCFKEYRGMYIGGLSSAYFTECNVFRSQNTDGIRNWKSPSYFRKKRPEPDISMLDLFEQQSGYKILLCHHPEYYDRYLKGRKIDLILSGHCHGGQWRYYSLFQKKWCGLFAPGQGLFPSLTSGINDGRLIISRGLSNTTCIPRINNPTEIIYCLPSEE